MHSKAVIKIWNILMLVPTIVVYLQEVSGVTLLVTSMKETAVLDLSGSEERVAFTVQFSESICSSVSKNLPGNGECIQESVSYMKRNAPNGSSTLVKDFGTLKLSVTKSIQGENWVQRRLRTRTTVCCERIGKCGVNCTASQGVFKEPKREGGSARDELSTRTWDLSLNGSSGCLDMSRRGRDEVWNLRCSEKLSGENLVFDELNWFLFFVPKGENRLVSISLSTDVETFVVGEEDFGAVKKGSRAGRVALDEVQKRVYWLTPESLKSIDYSGGNFSVPVIHLLLEDATENSMLTYEGGTVYWLQSKGETETIVKLEVNKLETTGSVAKPVPFLELKRHGVEDIRGFVIHSSVEPMTACDTARCSHFCLSDTAPAKAYTCWCPKSLPILEDEHKCRLPNIVVAATKVSDPRKMVLDYAFPTSGANGVFPVVEEVEDADNFAFTVNSRINTVCWGSGRNKAGKCKRGSGEVIVIKSSNISSAKDAVVFLDYENDTNTFYWGSNKCLSVSSLRNVEERAFSFGCVDIDTFNPYMLWPFAPGICVCNNKVGMMNTWFHVSNRFYSSTPFDTKEGNCTGIVGNYVGTLYFMHGRKVKAIKLQEMLDGTIPTVVWETDYKDGHSMDFNSGHLFWIGFKPDQGQFVDMIKIDVYVRATQSHKIYRSPPGTRIHSIRIFEPVMRVRADFHPCTDTKCSHFCFATSPIRQGLKDSFRCGCPQGLILLGRFNCGEPPEEEEADGLKSSLLAIAIILPSLLVLVIILVVLHQLRKRRNIARLSKAIQELLQGNQEAADRARDEMEKVRYLPFTKIIPENELVVSRSKLLGEGNFGVVYEGVYDNQAVAVKTLKNCRDLQMVSEFVLELKIMAHVGYHENIIQFFGAETSKVNLGKMLVVLELCPHGSLESYLQKNRKYYKDGAAVEDGTRKSGMMDSRLKSRTEAPVILNLEILFSWAGQLASGMAFLEERHVVHGDLATRNILVFDDNVIKISDFGFARNLYQYTTYVKKKQVPLPWRWGALETLERFEFSLKSDVWAYGVTIWEIFTLGNFPFPEEQWTLEFVEKLRHGLRLPENDVVCKRVYKDIMMQCWRINPDTRPDFKTIQEYFCN